MKRLFAALAIALALSAPAWALDGRGGGGGLSSVTTSAPISGNGTSGSPVTMATTATPQVSSLGVNTAAPATAGSATFGNGSTNAVVTINSSGAPLLNMSGAAGGRIQGVSGSLSVGDPQGSGAVLSIAKGHFKGAGGGTPAVSACGTTPAISGQDTQGHVTIGTGTVTSCTLTFAQAYGAAPECVVSDQTTFQVIKPSTSTTALTLTAATDMHSDVITYICLGN